VLRLFPAPPGTSPSFYYLVLLTALPGCISRGLPRGERIARALTVVTLGVLALSLLSPALRHGRFPLSGPCW
jgi:hypothetical protein